MCKRGRDLAIIPDFPYQSLLDYNSYEPTREDCDCVAEPLHYDWTADLKSHPHLGPSDLEQRFGHALASGDFNGDGFADLAVGIPQRHIWRDGRLAPGGAVALYEGSPFGLHPTLLIESTWHDTEFGSALAAGDINLDGYDDLFVGAPRGGGSADSGAVWVYLGGALGMSDDEFEVLELEGAADRFGAALFFGDISLDRLYVGAPGATVDGVAGAGSVAMYQWNAYGDIVLDRVLDQNAGAQATPGAGFGTSFAADQTGGASERFLAIGAPGASEVHVLRDTFGSIETVVSSPGQAGFGSTLAIGELSTFAPDEELLTLGTTASGTRLDAYLLDGTPRDPVNAEDAGANGPIAVVSLDNERMTGDVVVADVGRSRLHTFTTEPVSKVKLTYTGSIDGPSGWQFGHAMVSADFNGDGAKDLAVSAPTAYDLGMVAVFTGQMEERYPIDLTEPWKVLDLDEQVTDIHLDRTQVGSQPDFEHQLRSWREVLGSASINWDVFTEGVASLRIDSSGYSRIDSPVVGTNVWPEIGSYLSFDVYVPPAGQPNPWYLGFAELIVRIPSAGIDVAAGHVELTPLGTGWVTASFELPTGVKTALLDLYPDLTLGIAVNTTPGAPPLSLDHLRFEGEMTPHPHYPPQPSAVGPCSESTATDLGSDGNNVTVANDGCVMVRDSYPTWWETGDPMLVQTTDSGTYPVPFEWSSACTGASGSGQFDSSWFTATLSNTSPDCATLIDLQGSGAGNLTVRYFGQ
jgi:hypothetical protein